MTLPSVLAHFLVAVLLLGSCVWIGGFVTIVVLARSARRALEDPARVRLFRDFGRSYLPVAAGALALVVVAGGLLLATRPWDGRSLTTVLLAVAVVLATAVGVVQARRMTRLRSRALRKPESASLAARVARGARYATVLRAGIGVLTLALFGSAIALVG